MTNDRKKLVEDLFQEAADLKGDRRAEFLAQKCDSDGELQAEVEELLAHLERATNTFLSPDSVRVGAPDNFHSELPERIGQFRIIRKIGEGGMGTVYEAEQIHPRRRVALKVIRAGMLSAAMLRRFEHEANILGRLQHPGIAQIYEAGTAGEQRPFFAMEYVHGLPLLEYVERQQPSVSQRLELMARICDAVQHAHEMGVIHRDLKPANILIVGGDEGSRNDSTETDRSATHRTSIRFSTQAFTSQPKILDFGVARATGSDIRLATMQTEVGQLIGTLSYMSPEQIAARSDELDTRSDVYALGVILFEMLAGRLPYDLHDRSIPEAGRLIREQEATRLSSIDTRLRGDVETIVAKALEKDKSRRYQSPAELAADIRKYLSDEPILARPPSRAYLFRKFAKRNKALVGGVVAVFVVLIAGLVGIGLALVRARDAEKLALNRLQEAQRESDKAAAVKDFLQKMLISSDPSQAQGRDLTVRGVLDEASSRIDAGSLQSQPEVEAEIRHTIGKTYLSLGMTTEAEPHLRAALDFAQKTYGSVSDVTTEYQTSRLTWLFETGQVREAESSASELLAVLRTLHGDIHPSVAHVLQIQSAIATRLGKGEEGEKYARQAIATYDQVNEINTEQYCDAVHSLARSLYVKGDLRHAKEYYEQAIAKYREVVGDSHPAVPFSLNSLALLLKDLGDYDGAEQYLREALAIRRRLYHADHPFLAATLNDLGIVFLERGDPDQGEPYLNESLAMRRRVLGDTHFDVGVTLNNLGRVKHEQGKCAEEEVLLRQSLDIVKGQLGEEHPTTGRAWDNLAQSLRDTERLEEAEQAGGSALAIARKSPAGHPSIGTSCNTLGTILRDAGKLDEAEPLLREALANRTASLGQDHVRVAQVSCELAFLLERRGSFDEAETLARSASEVYSAKMPNHWMGESCRSVLGSAMAERERQADSDGEAISKGEALLVSSYEALKSRKATPPRRLREAAARLVRFYQTRVNQEQALRWSNELASLPGNSNESAGK